MSNSPTRKILLAQPPFYRLFSEDFSLARYPLTLGYLAGSVRRHTDWDVAIYNADFNPSGRHPTEVSYLTGQGFENYVANLQSMSGPVWGEIRSTLAEHRPDVVGVTAVSQTFTSARLMGKIAKQLNPRCKVIVGGPHASVAGGRLLAHAEIDMVVRGEGEMTLVDVLQAIDRGEPLDGIKGTIIRSGDETVENPLRPVIKDLDSLCIPHEIAEDVLVGYGQHPPVAFRYLFASRGCPFNCLFCGSRDVWGRKSRVRSPENVVREIQGLQGRGLKRLHFEDDLFGTTKAHIHELCDAFIRDLRGVQWSCELHANLVDQKTVAHMRAAGCYSILMGVESGSNEVLSAMRKSITIEQALEACKLIRATGIELTTFFLVGFPQETEATLAATVRAMRATKADEIVYSTFTPYPFSEAWELCRQQGLIGEDYDMSLYHHQSPLNHFCPQISRERFRLLSSNIERMVDRWNSRRKLQRKLRRYLRRLQPSGGFVQGRSSDQEFSQTRYESSPALRPTSDLRIKRAA
ncbi:MAG: radical SAM protein [Planctomycetia bacterium]|nr:radical SAM protein [Planctomycetia bacterium]